MKGAWGGSPQVHLDRDLCALTGASAVIYCRYYNFEDPVTGVRWWKYQQKNGYWRFVSSGDPSQRYRYLSNYNSDCRLQINDVQHADAGIYGVSLRTNFEELTSKTSTKLSVKGNNRNKPASKCLNHPSNFTLLPVIQS